MPIWENRMSQTGCFSFGTTEAKLFEQDDFSTSSSNNDDDEQEEEEEEDQVLMEEFHKVISKHMKLQKRHGDLLCYHERLIDSYALLEATHEVMLTMVQSS
jgi:hypothetical protein